MDTKHGRRASWTSSPFLILLFVIAALSVTICRASPVASPAAVASASVAEKPQAEVIAVAVELEMDEDVTDDDDDDDALEFATAASLEAEEVTISEELTEGAINVGELDDALNSESMEASYFVNRLMEPRKARTGETETDDEEEGDTDQGQARIGELGTIISVIKIATELGEAVLPVVIKEVEASPIGNLVIGVIGGINEGAHAPAGVMDGVNAAIPIPIKLARRAVKGLVQKAHPLTN